VIALLLQQQHYYIYYCCSSRGTENLWKSGFSLDGDCKAPVDFSVEKLWISGLFLWITSVDKSREEFSTGVFHRLGWVFHRISPGFSTEFSTGER
jgi:hypothetical protein